MLVEYLACTRTGASVCGAPEQSFYSFQSFGFYRWDSETQIGQETCPSSDRTPREGQVSFLRPHSKQVAQQGLKMMLASPSLAKETPPSLSLRSARGL